MPSTPAIRSAISLSEWAAAVVSGEVDIPGIVGIFRVESGLACPAC
jgi:hypothetical protein